MTDLNAALAALRDNAAAAAGPAPTAHILRRRRRRRAARGAASAAAGVAVVATIVLGAAALDRPGPVPPVLTPTPAPTTPGPSPTSTPSPASDPAAALPAGDPSLPFGVCGSQVDSPPAAPVTDQLRAAVAVDAPEATVGEPIALHSAVYWTEDVSADLSPQFETGVIPAQGTTFLLVRDGVVVGVDDTFSGSRTGWSTFDFNAEPGWNQHRASLVPAICSPGVPLADQPRDVPLPAGEYELYAISQAAGLGPDDSVPAVFELDGETLAARVAEAGLVTVLSEPVHLTLTGAADTFPTPADPADLGTYAAPFAPALECGQPAPEVRPTSDALRVEHQPIPAVLDVGGLRDLGTTVTYAGPGLLDLAYFEAPQLWFFQDGVVVGMTHAYTDVGYAHVTLVPRTPLQVTSALLPTACVDGVADTLLGPPVPPGEYQVYAGLVVTGSQVWVDGTWQQLTHDDVVYAGPFDVTVR